MQKHRSSEVPNVRILWQACSGEKTVGQLCREHGVCEARGRDRPASDATACRDG